MRGSAIERAFDRRCFGTLWEAKPNIVPTTAPAPAQAMVSDEPVFEFEANVFRDIRQETRAFATGLQGGKQRSSCSPGVSSQVQSVSPGALALR
jgi:hypothetical protein